MQFYLDTDGSLDWSAGDTTTEAFGEPGDLPIIGDWIGDGIAHLGVYRPSTHAFILDLGGSDSDTQATHVRVLRAKRVICR